MSELIDEKYVGEIDEITNIVSKLSDVFPHISFSIDYEFGNIQKFKIVCSDFDFYMKCKKFKAWRKILEKKYPRACYFCVYRVKS